MNEHETTNTVSASSAEKIPAARPAAEAVPAIQNTDKKAGMLRSIYERGARGISRLLGSGARANEELSTKLYASADPAGKGLENMSVREIVGNMGSAAGSAIESGVNTAAGKIDAALNPENKDYLEMSMQEIVGNMSAAVGKPIQERANAFANAADRAFNPEGKDYESMSMGEIFRNFKEFAVGKKEVRAEITAQRSSVSAAVAGLEKNPSKSALESAKGGLLGAWNTLVRYGTAAYNAMVHGSAEVRAQYDATRNKFKTYCLEQDKEKYAAKLEVIERKLSVMRSFAEKTGTQVEMPVAETAAPAAAA